MRRYNIAIVACLATLCWSANSSALQVSIDSFSASGQYATGSLAFTDTFIDGPPPPCGPNGCASQPTFYAVNSANSLPSESGGFLQLDTSNGVLSNNATGGHESSRT